MAITAFPSRSSRLLNRGLGAPASLGHVPHSSFFSYSNWFDLQLLNRGSWDPPPLLGAGFLYCILSPTDLISNCLTSCLHPGYIIVRHLPFLVGVTNRTHSTRPRSKLYPDIPWPDAPVIYTGAFTILTAWAGSICYTLIIGLNFYLFLVRTNNLFWNITHYFVIISLCS